MKQLILILFLATSTLQLSAQPEEFTLYDNGLIYSKSAMDKLSYVVDSLNLAYNYCDIQKSHHSLPQGLGHYIHIEKEYADQAFTDIENNMSWNDFVLKYKDASITKNILIVGFDEQEEGENIVIYKEITFDGSYGNEIATTPGHAIDRDNPWVYFYDSGSKYSEEDLSAYYFINPPHSTLLDEDYSNMIGYADCLIDTTLTKFKEEAESGYANLPENWTEMDLKAKQELLEEMRSLIVWGTCSMDDRPRIHATNIAKLSAETYNWKIFLRAHLDIMNDRFNRSTDGSYAQYRRLTYIKELEELDINVKDLLLGIALRISKPAKNHYYGQIYRIGRALSESKFRNDISYALVAMMEDEDLDDFNRLLGYFLLRNLNHYILDETEQIANHNRLLSAVEELPQYMHTQIKLDLSKIER